MLGIAAATTVAHAEADAGAPDAAAPPGRTVPVADPTTAPDPDPTLSNVEILMDFTWEKGTPVLAKASRQVLEVPRRTGRWMGRFAVELLEGPALLERVRFNFPLLADPPPVRANYKNPPSLENGLVTTVRVLFPAIERGNRLEFVDRATLRRWSVPWPLDANVGRTVLTPVAAKAPAPEVDAGSP